MSKSGRDLVLEKYIKSYLGLKGETSLVELIKTLNQIRLLLGPDALYVERAFGIARSSTRDDPLECHLVQLALERWSREPNLLRKLTELVELVGGMRDGLS